MDFAHARPRGRRVAERWRKEESRGTCFDVTWRLKSLEIYFGFKMCRGSVHRGRRHFFLALLVYYNLICHRVILVTGLGYSPFLNHDRKKSGRKKSFIVYMIYYFVTIFLQRIDALARCNYTLKKIKLYTLFSVNRFFSFIIYSKPLLPESLYVSRKINLRLVDIDLWLVYNIFSLAFWTLNSSFKILTYN